jgi:glycine cleavage system H lipoate-binding protein/ABC-type phosphate transport system substrate-binding protein
MKNLIFLISLPALFYASAPVLNAVSSPGNSSTGITACGDSLLVWCSPDLFPLASLWAEKFNADHPGAGAKAVSVPADRMVGGIDMEGNIGFVTSEYLPVSDEKPAWRMVVGRDVIVPVINPENPYLDKINRAGISREKFISAITVTENPVWGKLLGDEKTDQFMHAYWYDSGAARACLTAFLQTDPYGTNAELTPGADEVINRIHKDKYAVGFCRLADILVPENKGIDERVMLVPVDLNGNNQVDYFENIYGDPEEFARGVWIGKYPREFCGNIYCIAPESPSGKNDLAFLGWILGEGQQYLSSGGFTELLASEKYNKVQSLYGTPSPNIEISEARAPGRILLIVLAGVLLLGILVFSATGIIRRRRAAMETGFTEKIPVFDEQTVLVPGGLYFDRTHTWTFMEKDGSVRIGIDDFLQHITGRITKIKMKHISDRIKKGKTLFSLIQDGKQLDIYSPLSGVIKEANDRLYGDASVINRSPYMDGWIYRVEPDNWLTEIRSYFMGEKYRGWLKKEFIRLKDFIASALVPELLENSTVIMQEGGELRDNLLENLGPLYWEKFQTGFLDASV